MPNDKSSSIIESLLLSIIASVITAIGGIVLRSAIIYNEILPNLAWMIVFCVCTILILIILERVLDDKNSDIIGLAISCCLIFVFLWIMVHFLFMIVEIRRIEIVKIDEVIPYLKHEILLIMAECYLLIIRIAVFYLVKKEGKANRKKYKEGIKTAQEELSIINKTLETDIKKTLSDDIVGKLNGMSEDFHNSLDNNVSTKVEKIHDYLQGGFKTEILLGIDQVKADFQKVLRVKGMNSALTSTIIPFKNDGKGNITTYLIDNNAYPEFSWMFPGGHVIFDEGQSPESLAITRARDEAGLDVTIIDLYGSFDVKDSKEEQINNMTVFYPPHYLNLFRLTDKVRCYREKGHEYHIDAVYVAEANYVGAIPQNQKRLSIKISISKEEITRESIEAASLQALQRYYKTKSIKKEEQTYPLDEYVQEMLFLAVKDYISMLNKGKGV